MEPLQINLCVSRCPWSMDGLLNAPTRNGPNGPKCQGSPGPCLQTITQLILKVETQKTTKRHKKTTKNAKELHKVTTKMDKTATK